MLILQKHPSWTGFLWALVVTAPIGVITTVLGCIDMLGSERLSYSEFTWTGVHGLMQALYCYGLVGLPGGCPVGAVCISFLAKWILFSVACYCLIARRFSAGADRWRCLLGFFWGFPVMSSGVSMVTSIVVGLVGIIKHGI